MFVKPHRLILVAWVAFLSACQLGVPEVKQSLTSQVQIADEKLADVETPGVIYVGELHDQYPYHLNQLAVIQALNQRGLNVAVGLEMIQIPFQQPLDDYIEGRIDFETMLERTEYFSRWRIDPRHYYPIFEYAQTYKIPLIALNASKELTEKIGKVGIAGLDQNDRATLPDELIPPAPEYRSILEETFAEHDGADAGDVDRFILVQRVWDETMGKKSVEFLRDHPDHVLVVLAGAQHVSHGYGIPSRVRNDLDIEGTIVLSEAERMRIPDGGDIFLPLKEHTLPDSGRMGILINEGASGVVVAGFSPNSPARKAGMAEQDVITDIDGRSIEKYSDVRLALWDKAPGHSLSVTIRRNEDSELQFSFALY